MAEYTANVDALGTLRLLEAIRTAGLTKTVRFYQASTRCGVHSHFVRHLFEGDVVLTSTSPNICLHFEHMHIPLLISVT